MEIGVDEAARPDLADFHETVELLNPDVGSCQRAAVDARGRVEGHVLGAHDRVVHADPDLIGKCARRHDRLRDQRREIITCRCIEEQGQDRNRHRAVTQEAHGTHEVIARHDDALQFAGQRIGEFEIARLARYRFE